MTRCPRCVFEIIAVHSPTVFFFGEILIRPRPGIHLPIMGILALGIGIGRLLYRPGRNRGNDGASVVQGEGLWEC